MKFWKKKEVFRDERIEKESNKLGAVLCCVFYALLAVLLVIKASLGEPIQNKTLEALVMVVGMVYVVVRKIMLSLPGVRNIDELLKEFHNEILTKGFKYMLLTMVWGELIYYFAVVDMNSSQESEWTREWTWLICYLIIWLIPALIFTIASIKNGWMIWGSKKREKNGTRELAKRTAIGAVVFGVGMTFSDLFENGVFHPEELVWTLWMTLGFGIPFYFLMVGMTKLSEKKANEAIEEEEEDCEE